MPDTSIMAGAVDLAALHRPSPAAGAPPGSAMLPGPPDAFTLGLGVDPAEGIVVILGYGHDQWLLPPDAADALADALSDVAEQARNTPPPAVEAVAAIPQAG